MATEAAGNKKYLFAFFLFLFIFFVIYFGYFFIRNEQSNDTFALERSYKSYRTEVLLNDLKQVNLKPIPKVTVVVPKVVKKKPINTLAIEEKIEKKKETLPTTIETKKKMTLSLGEKPKLVLIIDDVHTQEQINAIQALHLKVTPSIFPPYSLAKHSNLLAKGLKHSMIHLPMESGSKQFNEQSNTLMTSFLSERIVQRVIELRQLFPKTTFVNSHTGSVFTSNFDAMQKLYITLKIEGFTFIDSFTTATSQVKKIAEGLGDVYLKRDVFIDNIKKIPAIHKQLEEAVKIAKEDGYAIAIGHPHKVTIEALGSAKTILKEVELIYIDELKVSQ